MIMAIYLCVVYILYAHKKTADTKKIVKMPPDMWTFIADNILEGPGHIIEAPGRDAHPESMLDTSVVHELPVNS